MPPTAAMNDELFRALRDEAGMPEEVAAKVARLIFQRNESAARADRESEREAARAVREAERAADREAFAAKDDVTVLQTKVKTVEDAIISIDRRFERIDERLNQIDERFNDVDKSLVRLDERINSLQSQNKTFIIPLSLLTLTALFGVIGLLIRLVMV